MEIKEPGHIYRQYNEINFYKRKLIENSENEHLFSVACNKEQFFLNFNSFRIDENENICSNNAPWFSLKNSKNNKQSNYFKINEGDVIKIGKIIIRIRRIKLNIQNKNNKKNNNNNNNNDLTNSISIDKINNLKEIGTNAINDNNDDSDEISINRKVKNNKNDYFSLNNKKEKKSINLKELEKFEKINNEESKNNSDILQKLCRICYQEEDDEKNPLIQPCFCSGSLKYIHLNCLKQWIGTRNYIRLENNEYCNVFLLKEVDCELCKSKLPDYIRHKNKLYKIIEFHTNYKNYLSFENLTLDKQNNKFIYIINLDKDIKIKIGRGHESNILLSDISVSRVHCFLNIENNNVYLEDNNSKYGTLVLIQTSKLNLIENLLLNLQIGRSFINCKVKKPFKFFGCCDISEQIDLNFYYKQNEKKIGMKKILTVKTEVDEADEPKENDEINEVEEWGVEVDYNVDEDDNLNRTSINFTKYNFVSNENCKNLLNSISYKKIEIISPFKKLRGSFKNLNKNEIMNDIKNNEIPMSLSTRRIYDK